MNRITRRALIVLGTGAAVAGAALLGAGVGGSALAGKGVTAGESSVAGTNWDTTAGGPNWRHSTVNVAGPAWEHFDVTDPAVGTGWAGPTWAGPTVVEA